MRVYLLNLWTLLRTSFWFFPSLFAVGSFFLYALMRWIDGWMGPEWIEPGDWLYVGEVAGIRAVLTAVAGSIITVISIVFSVVIVALTMAASQMGPRLLQNFMRDRTTSCTLGVFIGTFIYTMLVLRQTNGSDHANPTQLTVNVGLLLMLVSMGMLIYFIHHMARSLQAPQVVANVSHELQHTLHAYLLDKPADDDWVSFEQVPLPEGFDQGARHVTCARSGYIQSVDLKRLVHLAHTHDAVIRLPHRARDFIVPGEMLAQVFPGDRLDDALDHAIRRSFYLQGQRTAPQDVEYALNQLVEVGLRALSPSLNDPFTAMNCADRISEALCLVGQRALPDARLHDDAGALRLVYVAPDFADVMDAGFNQLRQAGATYPMVMCRLLDSLARIAQFTTLPRRLEVIRHHAQLVRDHALRNAVLDADREQIAGSFAWVESCLTQENKLQAPDKDPPRQSAFLTHA